MKYKFEMTDEYGSSRVLVETDSIFLDEILEHFKSFLQASGFGINYDDALTIEYADSEVNKILGSSKFKLETNFTDEEVEESPEEVTEQVKSWFTSFPQVKPIEYSVRLKTDIPDDEKIEHVDFMCREHDVSVSFEGDEIIYTGPLEIIKKAVINHYASLSYAKKQHPELFGE